METNILKRIDVVAVLSFIIPLFVYLLTLAPCVTFLTAASL